MNGGELFASSAILFKAVFCLILMSSVKSLSYQTRSLKSRYPKLIVFDLDNTLWTPELYTLRALKRENRNPIANKDVKLFPDIPSILQKISSDENFVETKLALASRTSEGSWAYSLIDQFSEFKDTSSSASSIFSFIEIYTGTKTKHFENIHKQSGIPYEDMLFFDDARDGKYGNCVPVAEMGVVSAYCPTGLTLSLFSNAVDHMVSTDKRGYVIDPVMSDASVGAEQIATIKKVFTEKKFGFCTVDGKKDIFFHFMCVQSSLGINLKIGQQAVVSVGNDKQGRLACTSVAPILEKVGKLSPAKKVTLPCFSMNLPFAALLANKIKTIESRNNTMFSPFENKKLLLHVGQRIYPDGDVHLEILKERGMDTIDKINDIKKLKRGRKGEIVAICEIGETRLADLEERESPVIEQSVCARGAAMGRYLTEIKNVEYLKSGVPLSGNRGVFDVAVDIDVLPDGWVS